MAGRLLSAAAAKVVIGRSKQENLRKPKSNASGARPHGGPVIYSRAMAAALSDLKPVVKVAVGQMTATSDLDANFKTCARLVEVGIYRPVIGNSGVDVKSRIC